MGTVATGWALLAAGVLSGAALAQASSSQVVLTDQAGTMQITGEMLSAEDGQYTVRTSFGTLSVDASMVICTGPGCPRALHPRLTFAVPGQQDIQLAETLVQTAAQGLSADLDRSTAGDGERVLTLREGGTTIGEIALATEGASADVDVAWIAAAEGVRGEQLLDRVAFTLLAHPDNPTGELNAEQIDLILAGQITNWRQVGGPDLPLTLYRPAASSPEGLALSALFPSAGTTAVGTGPRATAEAVAGDPGALGIVAGTPRTRGTVAIAASGPCGVSVLPDRFAVAAGTYPLVAEKVLRGRAAPTGAAIQASILEAAETSGLGARAFAGIGATSRPASDQGEHLIAAIRSARTGDDLDRLRRLAETLDGASQLPAVFRFASYDGREARWEAAQVRALAGELGAIDPDATEILVIGFSDELEGSGRGRSVSRARAAHVRDLLAEAMGPGAPATRALEVADFENAAPRACNDDATGREANRRVEIWLRPRR